MPVYVIPPPAHYQVSDGYAAAQGCRTVAEPLAYSQCENRLSQGYKTVADKSPAYFLGFTIAVLARADQMEQQFRAAPPSPEAQRNIGVATNLAITGRLIVEMAARKDGVSEADLPTVIFRTSAMPEARWAYWRAKPVPDWLARQAAQADKARP